MQIGFPNEALFARRGNALEYTVNGQKRMVRGNAGEPAVIKINGEEASINSKIVKNDRITIEESTIGEAAVQTISNLPEYSSNMEFIVNGQKIICPRFVQVNGELQSGDYYIQNDDKIEVLNYYTLGQLLKFMDIDYVDKIVKVNNKISYEDEKVYENFSIDFEDDKYFEDEEIYEDVNKSEMASEVENSSNIADIDTVDGNSQEVSKGVSKVVNTESIMVTVNGSPIILKNKQQYIFVDILDVYPFDTKVVRGRELIQRINGEVCDFTVNIKDGDVLELYWSD
jgi:sulfur carrier protein ThiS